MSVPLRIAFVCGGTPLVAGSILFWTWFVTGWGWWDRAWLWTIGGSLVLLVVGAAAVTRHFLNRDNSIPQRRLYPALAIALLILNLPVAVLYMGLVGQIASRYTVVVHNDSPNPIESLVVSGPGLRVELGPVPRDGHVCRYLNLAREGKLEFSARRGAEEHRGLLDNSAAPDSGGRKQIVIGADGRWQVETGDSLVR